MKRFANRTVCVALGAMALLGSAEARAGDAGKAPGAPTFNRDVAPLVFKNCAACHRPGEVAPFSLLTYADVKKRAGLIKKATASRFMPPWKPLPGHGDFREARRLSDEQLALLARWVDEGTPEGDPKDLPSAPTFPAGWQLGEPDVIVTLPKAYTVPAEGADVYRNFAIPFQVPAGKYVHAVEFRPSNRKVVHHAILGFDMSGRVRDREGKDGAPGFSQVNFPAPILPGSLAFWVPGKDSRPLPDGANLRWPTGADLVLQLHVHPSGKPEVEQSTIGIYFSDEAPRRNLELLLIQNRNIDIPAGQKDFRVTASRELPVDVEVFGIFPHMHLIGKAVTVTAVLPDGKERSLLQIDDWDFNWQGYYEYAAPVALPKGTKVLMECVHDNSAGNPSNPNQPPKRVVYGEETANEMAIVLLHAFPKGGSLNQVDVVAEARELIRRLDKDGDGKLDAAELGQIPVLKDLDLKEIVKRFDKDGDSKLDAAELVEALKALRRR
jgi:Ca2+-binding EF-hand superfamily protein